MPGPVSPSYLAAAMYPKQKKPPQWFNQMYVDAYPEMTAAPELWRNSVVWPWRGDQSYYGERQSSYLSFPNGILRPNSITRYGSGFLFDGNTWLTYENNENIAPSGPFTFAAFMRDDVGKSSDFRWFLSTAGSNNNGFRFLLNAGSGNHRFRLLTSNGAVNADNTLAWSAGDFIVWIMRYDGSTMFNFVRNVTQGIESEVTAANSGSITHESNFTIGQQISSSLNDGDVWAGNLLCMVMSAGNVWPDFCRDYFASNPFATLRPAGF